VGTFSDRRYAEVHAGFVTFAENAVKAGKTVDQAAAR
jgi:hypothetical protein